MGGVTVGCLYLPNGNPAPGPKFDYKLRWFERFNDYAGSLLEEGGPVVLAGDYNVIPTERDAYKPERWVDDALFLPETREAYRQLLAQGWTDALRHSAPGGDDLHLLGLFPGRLRPQRGHPHRPPAPEPRARAPPEGRRRGPGRARLEKTSDHAPTWIEIAGLS